MNYSETGNVAPREDPPVKKARAFEAADSYNSVSIIAAQFFANGEPMAEVTTVKEHVDIYLNDIRKENWAVYEWESKLISQIPDFERTYQRGDLNSNDYLMDSITASISHMKDKLKHYLPPALITYDENLFALKRKASEQTIQFLEQTLKDLDMDKYSRNQQYMDDQDDVDDDDVDVDIYMDPYFDEDQDPWLQSNSIYQTYIDDITAFFRALPFNLVFNAGFHYSGISTLDEEKCYCPCSWKMKTWQIQFHLDGICKGNTGKKVEYCSDNKFIHHALMSHLENIGQRDDLLGFIHQGIHKYIHLLYKQFNNGLGHKALFKMGDDNYKKVEIYERKKINDHIAVLMNKLNMEETQRRESEQLLKDMEHHLQKLGLQNVNKGKFDDITALTRNFREFNLELIAKKITHQDQLFHYQQELMDIFRSLRVSCTKQREVSLSLPLDFDLQKQMNTWYHDPSMDTLMLFQDFNNSSDVIQFLAEWNIQFLTSEFYNDIVRDIGTSRGKYNFIKESGAIDKGGPTAQFLNSFWKQVQNLTIPVKDINGSDRDIQLFEVNEGGFVPYKDEYFTQGKYQYITRLDVARKWYRAIGRVMIHSIMGSKHEDSQKQYPVPSHVIPKLFRSAILSGCSWVDDRLYYPWSEVLVDFDRITEGGIEFYKEEYGNDAEVIFGKVIPDFFLDSRLSAILGFREGISINGVLDFAGNIVKNIPKELRRELDFEPEQIDVMTRVTSPGIPAYFRSVPLEILEKIIFSKASVKIDDVLRMLRVKFWAYSERNGYNVPQKMIDSQKKLFKSMEVVLEECAKDSDSFLVEFLNFFTGFSYIPNYIASAEGEFPEPTTNGQTSFELVIEFNGDELPDTGDGEGQLPIAHTCEKTMKLPGHAYDGDKDIFKKKLLISLSSVPKGGFDMN